MHDLCSVPVRTGTTAAENLEHLVRAAHARVMGDKETGATSLPAAGAGQHQGDADPEALEGLQKLLREAPGRPGGPSKVSTIMHWRHPSPSLTDEYIAEKPRA